MSAPRPSLPLWKRILLVLGIALAIVMTIAGYSLYRVVHYDIPESYNAWTTGELLKGYLQTQTNRWPRSWDELADATNHDLSMRIFVPFDQLRKEVKIDWQADAAQLQQLARSGSNATIRVVTRLDGSRLKAVWGPDTEPNAKVLRCLRAAFETNSPVPAPATKPALASPPQ